MANGRRGARQMKHWHQSSDVVGLLTGNATVILASFDIPDPATLLRTLGSVLVAPTGGTVFSSGDRASCTFGLGIVSTDAFAVGATAMPDPATEEYDWLWYYKTFVSFEASVDHPGAEIALTDRQEIATKAMRKIKPRHTLVLLAEYQDLNGTPNLTVFGGFRSLFGT